ncbi:MAG TPA: GAK system XXXCH domain-containing protein [Desulfomicrobiaceae bacterium]|nr:GAK system XXXCH domain-containing protein [Desulfomicrobiaceae bacterium]
MAKSNKLELLLEKEQAKEFFRDFAEYLDGAGSLEQYGIDFSGSRKIKITLADDNEHLALKIKVKYPKSEDPGEHHKEKYTYLKKRMKTYFKAIGQAIAAQDVPSRELVSVFMDDSRSMVSYSGKGDEFYPTYIEACEAFQDAFDREDQQEMLETYRALSKQMNECHAEYK